MWQENLYDTVLNTYGEYHALSGSIPKRTLNFGLGFDHAFNLTQSLRFGVWMLRSTYEIQAFGPSNRTEYISNTRTITQIRVPLIYSHQVVDIKRFRSKLKLNVGTSANFYFTNNQQISYSNSATDTFQLVDERYNPGKRFGLPLLIGPEFQFYNKEGKDRLYFSVTRNIGAGALLSNLTYQKGELTNTYQVYMIPSFWSFNLGYLLPLRKQS